MKLNPMVSLTYLGPYLNFTGSKRDPNGILLFQ